MSPTTILPTIDDVVDQFFSARGVIFEHVGYVEDWRVLPINDSRNQFWAIDKDEQRWIRFSPSHQALMYWLAGHADEYGPYSNVQRTLRKRNLHTTAPAQVGLSWD